MFITAVKQYFDNVMTVSFIGERNWSPWELTIDLQSELNT